MYARRASLLISCLTVGLGLSATMPAQEAAGPSPSTGPAAQTAPPQSEQGPPAPPELLRPTFKTSVKLVSVAAVVRDGRGRIVRGLRRDDFTVLEYGHPRPIVNFAADDEGPISLAILFDSSGSMHMGSNLAAGREAVRHILGWVQPRADEVGLFSFDKDVRQDVAFTRDPDQVERALDRLRAGGTTSLYDAVAQTAKFLADRPSPRRAMVVITDGLDTSSVMTANEVASLAAEVDVPVYVLAVVSPVDHPGTDASLVDHRQGGPTANLALLSDASGGKVVVSSAPAHASAAARELITELRHQYLLAVESSRGAGWFALDVRTRNRSWNVRARSGYLASSSSRQVG